MTQKNWKLAAWLIPAATLSALAGAMASLLPFADLLLRLAAIMTVALAANCALFWMADGQSREMLRKSFRTTRKFLHLDLPAKEENNTAARAR